MDSEGSGGERGGWTVRGEGWVGSDGGERKGEGWKGEKWGGMEGWRKGEGWGAMEKGGGMGMDGEGRKGKGWRGDGVVWSEGGRGAELTHRSSSSPVSIHGRWPLFMTCGGHFGWWWFTHVVVCG